MDVTNHLLFFATDVYGSVGGIAQFNQDLCAAITDADETAEITIIPRRIPNRAVRIPPKVMHIERAASGVLSYSRAALSEAIGTANVCGVVAAHLHLLPFAYLAARIQRVPLVLILHGIEAWTPTAHWTTNRLASFAPDSIGSVSDVTRRRFSRWSGYPIEKITVLGNSVDVRRFTPGAPRSSLVDQLELRGRRVLLSVGRLVGPERKKGFDVVLEVLPKIVRSNPAVVYVIAGSGPDEERLRAKAASLGVGAHVRFVGYIPEHEKVDYYRLAEIFLLPSEGEGFGIVLLEAMATGLSVIASTRDGGFEAVRGGKLGTVVDPRDADAVTAAVLCALAEPHPADAEDLAYFSFDAFADRWTTFLNDCGIITYSRKPLALLPDAT